MPHAGLSAAGCKGRFSSASPTNGLALLSSRNASTRHLFGFINSWPKAILAAGFFTLTNYVIFEDVLRHGAVITTDHLLSFAVLVGTFAAGHWFWPTLASKEFGTAAGLALLFAAGTVYCVLTSAGRNAEALANKAAKVTEANGPYAELERKAQGAKSDLTEAQGKLTAAENGAKAAATKADDVCRENGSKSWKCRTERTNADAAEGRKAKAEQTRDDKKGASIMAEARLSVATKKDTNVDLKYAAKVLGYIGVTVTDDMLADIVPFIKSVFCEFATLLFAAGAFGHRRGTVPQSETPATVAPPVEPSRNRPMEPSRNHPVLVVSRGATVPRVLTTVPAAMDGALVLLRQHLAVHETVFQSELVDLFGTVSKSTVSRWCDAWERDEIIVRTVSGRDKIVSLAAPKRSVWRIAR